MTPVMMPLLIWIPLKAPLDKHNDELYFSCQATHVWMIDSSVKLRIYLFSKDQFFSLLYKPMKLLKTHTTIADQGKSMHSRDRAFAGVGDNNISVY